MTPLDSQPLFDEATIAKRIAELGKQISEDYENKSLVVVGVLKGSVIFLADLIRKISVPLEIEFIGVTSYQGTESTGHVQITQDLRCEIKGRHVLVVEDIVDTGLTIDYLLEVFNIRQPSSLKICTLLSKPDSQIMKRDLDYVGFEISKEFVVGYGLDLDGAYRQLPYIAQIISD